MGYDESMFSYIETSSVGVIFSTKEYKYKSDKGPMETFNGYSGHSNLEKVIEDELPNHALYKWSDIKDIVQIMKI